MEKVRDYELKAFFTYVIEPTTGAKVDLVPLPRDPFTRAAFQRRQRMIYDKAGHSASFITPEDIVVAKLVAHRETGSDKHLRDARGVLLTQWGELDLQAIRDSARQSSVLEIFEKLYQIVQKEMEE